MSSDLRIELHFYLIRRILDIKEEQFEKRFLGYFQKARKNSLLKEILNQVVFHELVGPHITKLTLDYISTPDHNRALSNLVKVINFKYFKELKLHSAVFRILREGRFAYSKSELKVV